jgi:uncharacterized protein YuzE
MAGKALTPETLQHLYEVIPPLLRLPSDKVRFDYDQEADVLYVSLDRPQQATDTECLDDQGVLLRYRGKELVGITILEASKRPAGRQPSGYTPRGRSRRDR